jgi:hypothetical protein
MSCHVDKKKHQDASTDDLFVNEKFVRNIIRLTTILLQLL